MTGAASVDEGSLYTLTIGPVVDPGEDTVTTYIVHWDDGTPDITITAADLAAASNHVTHTFADGSTNATLSVDLIDEDGTHAATGELSITVGNVAPSVALGGPLRVDEGSPYTLAIGPVSDPGDDTVTQYIVRWDDGTPNSFSTVWKNFSR